MNARSRSAVSVRALATALLALLITEGARAQGSDDCSTPHVLGTAGSAAYDTTSATSDFPGQSNSCGPVDHDVWFEWTAPASGLATVATCGLSTGNTSIAVYPAGSCPQGEASACDDDGCAPQSTLSFPATAGATYLIQIGDASGAPGGTGLFQITLGGPTVTPYCSGDGSATACPCGNAGAIDQGCANSSEANGARLTATGTASVSADSLLLACSGMVPGSFSLFLQGSQPFNGGAGVALGDGLRCIGGTLVTLGVKRNGGGASAIGAPNGDVAISVAGNVTPAGGTLSYQCWYRDPTSFCTPGTFNTSNGLEVVWIP
jgi:hypothetical protein